MTMEWTRDLDEAGVVRLAELLALKIRSGDVIALSGDLGAGKTTLARALIGAVLRDGSAEVPSPTFSLHQSYVSRRLTIAHFDFYRLSGAHEAAELGFEDAAQDGAVIVEWPERAAALLPETRIEVVLAETSDPDVRRVTLRGLGGCGRPRRTRCRCDGVSGQAGATGPARASPICRAMHRRAATLGFPSTVARPC